MDYFDLFYVGLTFFTADFLSFSDLHGWWMVLFFIGIIYQGILLGYIYSYIDFQHQVNAKVQEMLEKENKDA